MESENSYQVFLEEKRFPGKTVVIVEEPGCMTMRWPFFDRKDAERKARAEIERLRETFSARREAMGSVVS